MLNIPHQLSERSEPIKVGVIGAGLFGENLIDQVERVTGMRTVAVADLNTEKAKRALTSAGVGDEISTLETSEEASAHIDDGNRVILSDGLELATSNVDVVVEATGLPNVGAKHAHTAIQDGKHVVMVTVEADTVVGPILSQMAENNGVTYTMAYGDQPAEIVELCDWARTIGLDIVAVGKGNAYLEENHYGTPDDVFERIDIEEEFAEEQDLNPKMWNSFFDGTKVAVEMCAVANATGLKPDVSGMHLPTASIPEIPQKLRPKEDGGLLNDIGVVDTVSTLHPDGTPVEDDISNGIFIVTSTPNERVQDYLEQYDGEGLYTASRGKYQVFYRPFHLPGLETTVSIANAVLRNEPTGYSKYHAGEVVGAAKRDLSPGEKLDGGGGSTVYGTLVSADAADDQNQVPLELLEGGKLVNEVKKDEIVTYDDVELEDDTFIYALRNLQEKQI